MFSLDQLIQLKKSRPASRNINPPSLSEGEAEQQLPSLRKVDRRCRTRLAKILYCLNPAVYFFAWHL